jgi:NADPH2:quinone reductase
VRIRVVAAGINFIEVYQRTGLYPVSLPHTPGSEAAGVIDAVGEGVNGLQPGMRVATTNATGAYAEYCLAPADRVVVIPNEITEKQAAAAMLQGMTAHYLATSTYALGPGTTCLVHAAAGGVGLLLCQIARRRGAHVIGTVSTEEKAELARQAGANDVILYSREDVVAAVKRLAPGGSVDVVYDSVGKSTWTQSLACLRPRGMMVSFGNASGPVPPIEVLSLSRGGSLFLTRPTLVHYVATRAELEQRANDLFDWIADGSLHVRVHREYELGDAAGAHRDLESRATMGKLLLIP